METMKQSGVRWIGEIPSSWNTKRIKYMANLKGRIGWQGLTSEEYQDEGAYLITGVDFDNGGIDWENCVHVPMRRWEEAKDIQIQNGDLLITKDGTIGKVAIVSDMPGETSLNSGVLRIMPIEGYSRRFLYWVIKSDEFWNWFNFRNAGNSTIIHLYQGDFAEFLYAFPDYDEQEAIADYLDEHCSKLDSIIADLEKQIKTLKTHRKSLITETVTKGLDRTAPMKDSGIEWIGMMPAHWETKRLKYLGTARNGLTYDPADIDETESGTLVLRSSNIQNEELSLEDTLYVNNMQIPREIILQEDDILLCSRNGSRSLIGKCILIDSRTVGETYGEFMCVFKSKHNKFLHYVFLSELFNYYFPTFLTSTVNQLTNQNLYNMVVPVTFDKEEQNAIVDYLDKKCSEIDKIIYIKNQQLEKMINHRSSLIYEYVTGKKRVKEVQ